MASKLDNLGTKGKQFKDMTPEERAAAGRKGGIASGEAKRRKKALKETLDVLLSMPMKSGKYVERPSKNGVLFNCVGRYKHSTDYWNKPQKLEKEAFAHFFEATVRNDMDKLSAFKSIFPNAYADFEDMLRRPANLVLTFHSWSP